MNKKNYSYMVKSMASQCMNLIGKVTYIKYSVGQNLTVCCIPYYSPCSLAEEERNNVPVECACGRGNSGICSMGAVTT